ncbi:MAG: hypothetical protein WCZ18_02010 [Ottowia sp.]|nr:hypothetical protein [Ottowia sp.]
MTRHVDRAQVLAGLVLLAALALPAARQALESSMWRHMIVQFPLFLLAGALLAAAVGPRARRMLDRWNQGGLTGLVLAGIVLAVLMVPRVLDLALYQPRVEAAKLAALLLAGAALRLSWQRAGLVLQFFFLGNVLAMMAIVGMLYIDSPVRLCNAYLLDDQERLGRWLTAAAAVIAVAWLAWAGRRLMREEAEQIAAQEQRDAAQPPAQAVCSSIPACSRRG